MLIGLGSLLAFIVSGSLLGRSIAQHYKTNPPSLFYVFDVETTEFKFKGFEESAEGERTPRVYDVRVADNYDQIDESGELGTDVLVTFGDRLITIPREVAPRAPLPGMMKYREWLSVLLWRPSEGFDIDEVRGQLREGGVEGNLAIVARRQGAGLDPDTFGAVDRDSWVYVFWELRADGTVEKVWRKYPERPKAFARRVNNAGLRGEEPPTRDPNELDPDSWRFAAAMLVTPKGKAPAREFNRDALQQAPVAWVVTGTSLVVSIFAFGFAFAPSRVRPAEDQAGPDQPSSA